MLPSELYSAEQVRALDAEAIRGHGIPGADLMERAGVRAYRTLRARWPSATQVHVVCGAGNNGGDGFVVARCARRDGLEVRVHLVGDMSKLDADAQGMLDQLAPLGIAAKPFVGGCLADAGVIVDALLGTGLARAVARQWAQAVDAINATAAPVLAVDIPSGLHADTGKILGRAVQADVTTTYIGLKRGLFTGFGPALCGGIVFDGLAVPRTIYDAIPSQVDRIDRELLRQLGRRSRVAHKGTHGHVLVLGGEQGYSGAVRLAGAAAARAGAGLVSVGTRAAHADIVNVSCPELMVRGVETEGALRDLARRADVVALGPGLGTQEWARSTLRSAMALRLPMVVDADALNLLAAAPVRRENWILTPHPAEAGRLLGCSTGDVQADRFTAAATLAARYGGVCVLKGAGTVVTDGTGRWSVCSDGNPGLATGGTGDVLTGVIAAFHAQGHGLLSAARLGVCAHAAAGDLAARAGERGMLASDVIEALRVTVNPRD